MSLCTVKPVDNSQRIRKLEDRVRVMEKELAGIKEITGVCTLAAEQIVPLLSASYDAGTSLYTIEFSSTEGEVYQIQDSGDGVTWGVAGNVDATADAVITEWTSTATYAPETVPIFFRVRLIPRPMLCAPALPC